MRVTRWHPSRGSVPEGRGVLTESKRISGDIYSPENAIFCTRQRSGYGSDELMRRSGGKSRAASRESERR